MKKKILWSVVTISCVGAIAFAGGSKKPIRTEQPDRDVQSTTAVAQHTRAAQLNWQSMRPDVGTFTTLSGYWDYQSNGGAIQHIRVNPANGNIHVIYQLADDSTAGGLNASRRTAYAFSSNGGTTWTNFSNVRVPARRSGYPTLDLLKGVNAGLPAVANHSVITGTQVGVFVDSPEGAGAFSELSAPPLLDATNDEPNWPYVAGASDGSIVVAASRSVAATVHYNRTVDLSTWSPWSQFTPATQSGGRNPVQANGTGRVGILANTSNGTAALGNWWIESTNNGQTWGTPVNLFPTRVVGADTFNSYVHADFVYNGNTPLFAFSEYITDANKNDADIVFWSQATGFRVAVPYDSTKYFIDPANQRFHALQLGWPSIGLSGSTIVIAFQAFQPDTDARGYNYSDVWYVASSNGGNSWGSPQRLTNTRFVDERYPSVAKWNATGQFNMVWSQKAKSGLYGFPGGADTIRSFQVFNRVSPIQFTTSVGNNDVGLANAFKLEQNFPNPFNPATNIDYTVSSTEHVSIKVHSILGQEVATLVNEVRSPGNYQVAFDGAELPSGVYIYTMKAGSFSESKKMALTK